MPDHTDYKEPYLTMMRAFEEAIRTLVDAQRDCEEQILQQAEEKEGDRT